MNKRQRIQSMIRGLLSIVLAFILVLDPEEGYSIVILILNIMLLITGLNTLIYYITMARYMVEGQVILFRAVLLLDLAIFTLAIVDIPKFFIILYLVAIHAITGAINLIHGLHLKKIRISSWKMHVLHGIGSLAVSTVCIVFASSMTALVFIYCLGLVFSGVMDIVSVFRHTEIVYIQ